VFSGGLSGVAFGADVSMVSRITQGCKPVSRERTVTEAEHNLVVQLDGEPALDVLLKDLAISLEEPQHALDVVRATLVGLTATSARNGATIAAPPAGNFGSDTMVRHIIGLDPGRRGVAIADHVQTGMRLAFCQRNVHAARADLTRICAEIREELEPEEIAVTLEHSADLPDAESGGAGRMLGAVYVSCSGRGGPHFGGPSAELQIVRRVLGDVPLVGFFAGGEIAHDHLYGYTGVLTVFTTHT
jgi:small ligand-binding sensory domain FIST